MTIKETRVLNGKYTVYIEFHDFYGDPPDDVNLSPIETIDGKYVFSLPRHPTILANEDDTLAIHFEKI